MRKPGLEPLAVQCATPQALSLLKQKEHCRTGECGEHQTPQIQRSEIEEVADGGPDQAQGQDQPNPAKNPAQGASFTPSPVMAIVIVYALTSELLKQRIGAFQAPQARRAKRKLAAHRSRRPRLSCHQAADQRHHLIGPLPIQISGGRNEVLLSFAVGVASLLRQGPPSQPGLLGSELDPDQCLVRQPCNGEPPVPCRPRNQR